MKKSNKIILLVLFMGVCITGYFVSSTYAKYVSEITATGTVKIAKWNFITDTAGITNFNIKLNDTNLVSNSLASDDNGNYYIAPGTEGSFTITLKNTSDVAVKYDIELTNKNNVPTNLKFYKDTDYTNEITDVTTHTLNIGAANVPVNIYWKWDYETENGDAADTTNGENGNTMTIDVKVTGTQVNSTPSN